MDGLISSGHRLANARLTIASFLPLLIAVLAGFDDSVRAAQPAPLPHIPHKAAIRILWQPGAVAPANMEDLRLDDLEDAAGILRWVWGMEIPPGKKLVIHLHGGDSGSNPPRTDDQAYEVTGPLEASFGNRISLVRQVTNQNQAEQLSLQIRTRHLDDPARWAGVNPVLQFPADPTWSGERGSSGATEIPGTIWEQHLGPPQCAASAVVPTGRCCCPRDPDGYSGADCCGPKVARDSRRARRAVGCLLNCCEAGLARLLGA